MHFFISAVSFAAAIGLSAFDVASAVAGYTCDFPDSWDKYSIIVKDEVTSGIKNYYGPILVGGKFTEFGGYNKVVDGNRNCYFGPGTSNNLNMNVNNAQKIVTDDPFGEAGVDFSYFEWLALNIEPKEAQYQHNDKIIVYTKGGKYNVVDFRGNNAQGSDNGKTLVVFDTDEEVELEAKWGRQIGASILAPFSHVKLNGNAGYIDGILVAKTFETFGGNQGGLQAHAQHFRGSIDCKDEEVPLCDDDEPEPEPEPEPQPEPEPEPSSNCPPASDPFTVSVYITHKGSNGSGVNLGTLENEFKNFYNTKSDEVCDPHTRVVESVTIDPNSVTTSVIPDGTLNGFRAKYTVSGKCTGCNNGPQPLVDDECVPPEPPENQACCNGSLSRFVFAADFFDNVGFTYEIVKVENVIPTGSCPANKDKRVQYDGTLLCY